MYGIIKHHEQYRKKCTKLYLDQHYYTIVKHRYSRNENKKKLKDGRGKLLGKSREKKDRRLMGKMNQTKSCMSYFMNQSYTQLHKVKAQVKASTIEASSA